MVAGHPILQAMGSTAIECDVSADGADGLARWIRGVEEAVRCGGFGDTQIDHSRFHHG